MTDREARLPIKWQAQLLGISRGTVYYHPEPTAETELALMRRIDELHLEHPIAGSRMLRDLLRLQGLQVGRRHVSTLMRRMGIQALYRKLNTSRKHPAHPVFPYALRGLSIERANQVWALDITYIPMARGWVHLVAVLDWASRRVLAHRVSITMEADFCVEALREAVARIRPAKSSCAGDIAQGCSCPRQFIADTWTLQESSCRADGHGGGMRRNSGSRLCRHAGSPGYRSRPSHWPMA